MAQRDLSRMAAYAAMSQMGFCLMGLGSLTPQGIAGCLVHMCTHGAIAALLALVIGALHDRARTRDLAAFGGLGREAPVLAFFAALAFIASIGLPGLSGFWGETLALVGAFPTHPLL